MTEEAALGGERSSVPEIITTEPSEETPLLNPVYESIYRTRSNASESTVEESAIQDEEIDPNAFDLMLSRSTSYTSGLGIEAESQETPMLRGPRIYGQQAVERRLSQASLRRKSTASSFNHPQTPIMEASEEDEDDGENRSPFLQGVSVRRFWLIFGCNLICFSVACFDSTIMVSSHPVITSYFNSSNSASWLSTAFLLTSTSFQPLCGRLSDSLGRKPPFVTTIAIFLGATIWCALAQSMTSFIMARAVCGLGAGGMMAIGSIITSDLVPIEIRGTYQSYLNIVYGIGSTLGAATGGAIADHLGWRWEFGVQVPAIVICLCISIICVPDDLGLVGGARRKTVWEATKTFDFKGSILLTTSLTFLILGLVSLSPPFPAQSCTWATKCRIRI